MSATTTKQADPLTLSKTLMTLAKAELNQPHVVREPGCLSGLVAYLENGRQEIVANSVQALQFLSQHPQNKVLMREFPGLLDGLTKLYESASSQDGKADIAQWAKTALQNLGVSLGQRGGGGKASGFWGVTQEDVFDDKENAAANKTGGSTFGSGSSLYSAAYHTLKIHVDGLDADYDNGSSTTITRVLVNVKGVISVLIEKHRGIAVIGTRTTDDDALFRALRDVLQRAGHVGKRWPVVASTTPSATIASPSSRKPVQRQATSDLEEDDSGYLDAEEYDSPESDRNAALARWGCSSLEARLAEQKREEERRAAKFETFSSKVNSAIGWLAGW